MSVNELLRHRLAIVKVIGGSIFVKLKRFFKRAYVAICIYYNNIRSLITFTKKKFIDGATRLMNEVFLMYHEIIQQRDIDLYVLFIKNEYGVYSNEVEDSVSITTIALVYEDHFSELSCNSCSFHK